MNPYAISALVNFISSIVLGSFVLYKKRTSQGIAFFLFCFFVAFWSISYFFWQLAQVEHVARFWVYMLMAGAMYIPASYLHFVYAIVGLLKRRRLVLVLTYVLFSIFLISSFSSAFISHLEPQLRFPFWPIAGPLFSVFLFTWLLYVIYTIFILAKHHGTSSGTFRLQLKYVLLGTAIGFIGGSTNYFLFYRIHIPPVGNALVAIYVAAITYAIVRHRLMDIKVVLTQLFVLALWAFILLRTLISPLGSQEQLINVTLLGFTVVIGFLLVRSVVKEVRQREAIEELNVKLKQANEQLESLLDIKNEFLQIASHQLRTPVSVMRGMLDMMREGKGSLTPEQQSDMVERAYLKSEKLNQVIDDVLSATEMDVPNFDISGTARPVDLVELARKAVDSHRDDAAARRVTLTLQASENTPRVNASETYVPQAMTNLIDNAIKYTKEGSVTVKVYSEGDKVVFAVQDTGIGVPEGDLPQLWTKFKRAANAKDMHTDGSGLGLFIIKKIIEGHPGGTVFSESRLNRGSTFGFKLPMMKET